MPAKRLPRFERRPQDIPSFELTERDEAIMRIVARLRFARSTHIVSLLSVLYPGASEQKILRRLQALFHAAISPVPRRSSKTTGPAPAPPPCSTASATPGPIC